MPLSKEAYEEFKEVFEIDEDRRDHEELRKVVAEMATLQARKKELTHKILKRVARLHILKNISGPTVDQILDKMFQNVEGMPLQSTMNLGDALETILRADGPQFQKEIIEKIRAAGIRLSEKNPYVVLHAVIHRDARKRFVSLDDGRVSLTSEGKEVSTHGHKSKKPNLKGRGSG